MVTIGNTVVTRCDNLTARGQIAQLAWQRGVASQPMHVRSWHGSAAWQVSPCAFTDLNCLRSSVDRDTNRKADGGTRRPPTSMSVPAHRGRAGCSASCATA